MVPTKSASRAPPPMRALNWRSSATVLDGYAMARQGTAGEALGISLLSGLYGGLFGLAVLVGVDASLDPGLRSPTNFLGECRAPVSIVPVLRGPCVVLCYLGNVNVVNTTQS